MARSTTVYVCSHCNHTYAKWQGQCTSCHEWDTIVEQQAAPGRGSVTQRARPRAGLSLHPIQGDVHELERIPTHIVELDRVLGGGMVPGGVVLISGEPGIGKSTLLLQLSASMARRGRSVVYISGEESHNQVRMRAHRLGFGDTDIQLSDDVDAYNITQYMASAGPNTLIIVDSIQTMQHPGIDSLPGSTSQVRESANILIRAAKQHGIPMVVVCHILKDGNMAGPKLLEHAVDVVLEFSGERGIGHRLLRSSKNRFGSTEEVGVFEMGDEGLVEVENPSGMFLSAHTRGAIGSAVFPALEGSRVVLVEVQALIAQPTGQGNVRRSVVGWDSNRLAMVLAVLEARCGLRLSDRDIFLNVAGGFRVQDPAADFAVAAALLSAFSDRAVLADSVFFGEVGLSGELRPARGTAARLRESVRLGLVNGQCSVIDPRMVPEGCNPQAYTKLADYVSTVFTGV